MEEGEKVLSSLTEKASSSTDEADFARLLKECIANLNSARQRRDQHFKTLTDKIWELEEAGWSASTLFCPAA